MRDTTWESGKEWRVGRKRKDWGEKNRVRWKRWQKKYFITKAIFIVEQEHKLGNWTIAWTIKLPQNTIEIEISVIEAILLLVTSSYIQFLSSRTPTPKMTSALVGWCVRYYMKLFFSSYTNSWKNPSPPQYLPLWDLPRVQGWLRIHLRVLHLPECASF